jgi:hypothetical protein
MREDPSTFELWVPSRADVPAPPAELTVTKATEQDVEGCVVLQITEAAPADQERHSWLRCRALRR